MARKPLKKVPPPLLHHATPIQYIFEVFSLEKEEWGLTIHQLMASNLVFFRHRDGKVTTFKSRFRQCESQKPAEEFEKEFQEVKHYHETGITPASIKATHKPKKTPKK